MIDSEASRSGSVASEEGFLTADMIAQHAYCPRRLYLMYADARWADNEHTMQGAFVHRNADAREDALPAEDSDRPKVAKSVSLDDTSLGLRAKLDLLELDGGTFVPVEIKKGEAPDVLGGTYRSERLQLGVQMLLLRSHAAACERGFIYYAASKKRVEVLFTHGLETEVHEEARQVRLVLAQAHAPDPLEESPKCAGCSLVGICLPDETWALRHSPKVRGDETIKDGEEEESSIKREVRRFFPARDDALPLYVQEQGATIGKTGEAIVVRLKRVVLAQVRLLDISQLVICGNVSISAQAMHLLCEAGIPIVHLSTGHWFHGTTQGFGLRNAYDRAAQFERCRDELFCLEFAKVIVEGKGRNQRTLLRRNGPSEAPVLKELKQAILDIHLAANLEGLLGREGRIAALYFGSFESMLSPKERTNQDREQADRVRTFDFNGRNRRPPKDPVNAMLSFGYACLAKDATVALVAVGLDPYWGFYHQPRHGRPALALDLMEEFRALVVDSAVITAVNTGVVGAGHFEVGANGCALNGDGRRAFLRSYEARMDMLLTHPVFDYRVSMRRVLMVQAALMARYFRGDIDEYIPITAR
jgi:CRISPR-associated protein Cas1